MVQTSCGRIVIDAQHRSEIIQLSRHAELGAAVVDCVGSADFAAAGLQQVDTIVPVGAWTVFHFHDDAPPEMMLAATRGREDVTGACWRLYRDELYKTDHSFDQARSIGRDNCVALTHLRPAQLADAHRAKIYDHHELQERISLVVCDAPGTLLAINFYRFAGQPAFALQDRQTIAAAAPILIAAVRRHIVLSARQTVLAAPAPMRVRQREITVLQERCPRLTTRELEVCAGLVQGWTFDGIAVHLNVSLATVRTYRDRAFRRLGIHHRNQLYGMCMAAFGEREAERVS